jgi:cytochrome d ubiquinol oxidase subunit I
VVSGQIWFSMIVMCALYAVLGLAGFGLTAHYARKGPENHKS